MIPYSSILQLVDGQIYSLHHIWSSFHIYKPASETVGYIGISLRDQELLVCYCSGDQYIYQGIPGKTLNVLQEEKNIDAFLPELQNGSYEKRLTDGSITPVPVQDVLDVFCRMQDHIVFTSGLWATDVPDKFADHPAHHLLFPIKFEPNA
jgi:hypothetical protein